MLKAGFSYPLCVYEMITQAQIMAVLSLIIWRLKGLRAYIHKYTRWVIMGASSVVFIKQTKLLYRKQSHQEVPTQNNTLLYHGIMDGFPTRHETKLFFQVFSS
ncbi:hypothetical protein ACOSQ3_002927 [Xanthoceras sorbifolium]